MKKNEFIYYQKTGNWDFSKIKYTSERLSDWDFYKNIYQYSKPNSLCLDLGTGGGENVLNNYPDVGMIIATDFSEEMLRTAKMNAKHYPLKKIKFVQMDNLNLTFPNNLFDIISARHTVISAKQIYNTLVPGGVLIVEGIDKNDCFELKKVFGKGQGYNDKISVSEKDYIDLINAGFSKVEKVEIIEIEYYETENDLMALLLKTPILNNFSDSSIDDKNINNTIDKFLFDKYVRNYRTSKGILLKRILYGIIAQK